MTFRFKHNTSAAAALGLLLEAANSGKINAMDPRIRHLAKLVSHSR